MEINLALGVGSLKPSAIDREIVSYTNMSFWTQLRRIVMNQDSILSPSGRRFGWLTVFVSIIIAMTVSFMPRAQAEANDANKILKSMTDYVTSQKSISMTFDSDIEVITPELQKIQFTSSGQVQLSRPDKLRARRTGGYTDVELVFDGQLLSVNNKAGNAFAQIDSPGSVDQLIDLLRDKYGVMAPGADLLLSRAFEEMTSDVIDAKHIGRGVIDGVECEHLAFRDLDTDWQIWIEVGARPIPRKYVITSKAEAGAPQYTLRIKDWGTDVPADAFASRLKTLKKLHLTLSRTSTKFPRAPCHQEQ
jgi:hypothetical protein